MESSCSLTQGHMHTHSRVIPLCIMTNVQSGAIVCIFNWNGF